MPSGAAGLELCGKRVWVTGHNGIVGSTLLRRFVRQDTGAGSDIAIADLATLIAEIVGYEGGFSFATSRPNGTSRKLLDITRTAAFGWGPNHRPGRWNPGDEPAPARRRGGERSAPWRIRKARPLTVECL